MSKNRIKAIVAAVLVLTAIVLYGLLHDVSELALFQHPLLSDSALGKKLIHFFSLAHQEFMPCFKKFPFWKLVNNYLVDALWFTSFTMIMHLLLDDPMNYMLCIMMAVLSEGSQLLFPQLGSFDVRDILLYALILTAYRLTNQCRTQWRSEMPCVNSEKAN